jgi:hypothetical protein
MPTSNRPPERLCPHWKEQMSVDLQQCEGLAGHGHAQWPQTPSQWRSSVTPLNRDWGPMWRDTLANATTVDGSTCVSGNYYDIMESTKNVAVNGYNSAVGLFNRERVTAWSRPNKDI